MPKTSNKKPSSSSIVSFNEFRLRLETERKQNAKYDYSTVDHLIYRSARLMLGSLGINDSFALFVRRTRDDPSKVLELAGTSIVATTINLDDEEELCLDLKQWPIEDEERLDEPLRRFTFVTLLAHHFLTTRNRLNFRTALLNPVFVGRETVNLEGERKKEVTAWRAAAGLGIIATAHKREGEREEIKDYLADVVDWRHQHNMSFTNLPNIGDVTMWELMGKDAPIETDISNRLLGITNPLEGLDLRKIIRETK